MKKETNLTNDSKYATKSAGILSLAVSSIAFITACSGGGGGGAAPVTPLTAEQKQRYEMTLNSVGQVSSWQDKGGGAAPAAATTEARAGVMTYAVETSEPTTAPTAPVVSAEAMKAALQSKVLDPANCAIEVKEMKPPQQPAPNQPIDMTIDTGMKVAGQQCPIAFTWVMNMKVNSDQTSRSGSVQMSFSMNYEGLSPEAQQLDVSKYLVNFSFNAGGSESRMKGVISGDGKIVSKSQGTIKIRVAGDMNGNQQGSVATMAFLVTYPDGFTVELKNVTTSQHGSDKETQQYFLNGAPIDEKTAKGYMKQMAMDKAQSPT